jgi:hypothetical protein
VSLAYQVLSPGDLDEIYEFAEARLKQEIPDDTERTFHSWTVRWRKEALEHYLRLGWSFVARKPGSKAGEKGETMGFFLAQPLLFFRGQTQTLWVEHISGIDQETVRQLVDVAIRVAREKHLQRVLFSDADEFSWAMEHWKPGILGADSKSDKIAEVKTTKG